MKITIEQVEKLKEYAEVSYAEAKEALEATDGSLLDAIVYLEKQGKTTRTGSDSSTYTGDKKEKVRGILYVSPEKKESKEDNKGLWQFIKRIFNKGMVNKFEIIKNDETLLSIPVNLLLLFLVCFFWVTLPLLIVGLFLGCKYRFAGKDLGKDNINKAMDSASSMAENIKKSAMDEDSKKQD